MTWWGWLGLWWLVFVTQGLVFLRIMRDYGIMGDTGDREVASFMLALALTLIESGIVHGSIIQL